ncbi:MAG: LysR substrate-binding domain-containing protein [Gemmobacter sp.]|nr:LysR substrate-binding domain-containing protein [Gemmobacter sp.]
MRPTLRQIECFLAAADLGSFSRAAERLGLSQPALSQQIRDLEALLGLRLLDRTTRRVDLTPAGRTFRDQTTPALAELDRATEAAQGRARLRSGQLRLAAPPLLAAAILPQAIAGFLAQHPGLTSSLSDIGTEDILTHLRTGRADIGIGTFPPGLPDLDHRPILRDALMLFSPRGHPLAGLASSWSDVAQYPLITLTRDSGIRLLVELGFERANLSPRPVQEVTQITTALALVAAGLGIAVLPGYARVAPNAQLLACSPLQGPPVGREIAAVLPRDRSPEPAAIPFLDHLARVMRQHAP